MRDGVGIQGNNNGARTEREESRAQIRRRAMVIKDSTSQDDKVAGITGNIVSQHLAKNPGIR